MLLTDLIINNLSYLNLYFYQFKQNFGLGDRIATHLELRIGLVKNFIPGDFESVRGWNVAVILVVTGFQKRFVLS